MRPARPPTSEPGRDRSSLPAGRRGSDGRRDRPYRRPCPVDRGDDLRLRARPGHRRGRPSAGVRLSVVFSRVVVGAGAGPDDARCRQGLGDVLCWPRRCRAAQGQLTDPVVPGTAGHPGGDVQDRVGRRRAAAATRRDDSCRPTLRRPLVSCLASSRNADASPRPPTWSATFSRVAVRRAARWAVRSRGSAGLPRCPPGGVRGSRRGRRGVIRWSIWG